MSTDAATVNHDVSRPDAATSTLLARTVFPSSLKSPDLGRVYLRMAGTDTDEKVDGISVKSRTTLHIPAGATIAFDSFMNAFPAAHWRRWTDISALELRMRVTGACRVDVYRTSGSGRVTHDSSQVTQIATDMTFTLPLAGRFSDGGYYWFTIRAQEDLSLMEPQWHADRPIVVRKATVGICTFNRPDDCVKTLRLLASEREVRDHLHRVVIADQGDKLVEDHADFAEVKELWGEDLVIKRQTNLGGSGGFSRVMYETLQDADGGDVILTDDDISPEPESFLRAVMFASATKGRVLVHGHMLDLWSQARLHNTGDIVDRSRFISQAANPSLQDVDLTVRNISNTPEFSSRREAEFGGWWMCLIPRSVLHKLGLAMPVFIKWDDVEYGLRAHAAGHPTVTLPGVGVWHQPFYLKDVQTDWTAYFEVRNRLMTALIHGEPSAARTTIIDNLRVTVKNDFTMNYSAIVLNNMAIRNLLEGPAAVREGLPTVMKEVAAARAACSDAKVIDDVPEDFVSTISNSYLNKFVREPRNRVQAARDVLAALVAAGTARRGRDKAADLSGIPATWKALARLDRALVSTADGRGVTLRERDLELSRQLKAESLRLHGELLRRVGELQEEYQRDFADWVSPKSWEPLFDK